MTIHTEEQSKGVSRIGVISDSVQIVAVSIAGKPASRTCPWPQRCVLRTTVPRFPWELRFGWTQSLASRARNGGVAMSPRRLHPAALAAETKTQGIPESTPATICTETEINSVHEF